jgi:hypothetical protein
VEGRVMAYELLDDAPQGRYEVLPDAAPSKADRVKSLLSGDAPVAAMQEQTNNLRLGGIRGAGSIGATLVAPYDIAKDALNGKGLSLESNNERRQAMDSALSSLGADTNSRAYQGGKLGMEVAGTMGVGGGIANTLRTVPTIARTAAPLLDAIGSSGFTAGGMTGIPGLATRMAGGAVTGGASAGLISPEDAKTGVLIGAASAPIVMGAGKLGEYVGDKIVASRAAQAAEAARKQPLTDTLKAGLDAGYVVPPSSVNPTFGNSVKESISGKIATAQHASNQNQQVTDSLVRKSLGLADDAPLSVEALSKYRADMHAAGYDPLRQLGAVPADQQFASDLASVAQKYTGKGTIPAIEKTEINDLVKAHQSTGFDAGDAVDAIRVLRDDAKDAYRTGNSALGGAKKAIADAYEGALERALPQGSDILKNYQAARQNIAKSFTVEDALKEGTGAVDARKLAAALQKGTPLTGELLTAARFANAFPKATQPPSLVAGPGVHNLKAMFAGGAGATGGALGAMVAGPVGAAIGSGIGAGSAFVVPAAMRLQMFSKGAQKALLPQAMGGPGAMQQFAGLLANPELQQQVLRTSPTAIRGLLNVD